MTPTSPLRLMLWLKWTLLWRGYRASRMKMVGVIVMLAGLLPISLGGAWAAWILMAHYPASTMLVARDALAVIYLLWVVTPLLGFSLNESFDLTRLFAYPLSYRQIFFGSVLGSVVDMPVLLTFPTFGVLLAHFCPTPGAWAAGLFLVAAFLFHTLALGQAISLALIGFLRSRRFRDITIVLFPLLGMAYYIGQRVFFSQLDVMTVEQMLDLRGWRVAGYLPPGWAAHGLDALMQGAWGAALRQSALVTLAAVATLWAAAHTLQSLYLGDRGPLTVRQGTGQRRTTGRSASGRRTRTSAGAALLARFVPAAALAMAGKEWTYLKREPQYKAMAVNVAYSMALIGLPFLAPLVGNSNGFGSIRRWGEWTLYGLTGTLLLTGAPLLFNLFGSEGAAVTMLLSFPARRREMLVGKNLAHGALLLMICAAGLTGMAAVTKQWHALPRALALAMLAVPVMLAAGNLVSVRLPHRMLVRGQQWSKGGLAHSAGGGGAGCGYSLLYVLAYLGAMAALTPAACAAILPGKFGIAAAWLWVTLPLAAGYAGLLYSLLLGQAEAWLATREPELMARIAPEM